MPAGRPLKFTSVDDLKGKIADYFDTVKEADWTWTGLALFLETDKETLADYRDGKGERGEFSDSLKEAMYKVEYSYEKDLKKFGRTGTIFALKNFNWKDKTEVDSTVTQNTTLSVEGASALKAMASKFGEDIKDSYVNGSGT